MCRLLTLLVCIASFSSAFAQPSPNFESFLSGVISQNGGATLEGVAVAVTGSIMYPQATSPYPFALTVQRNLARFEIGRPEGAVTVIRRGQRIQNQFGLRNEPPDTSSLSTSVVNFTPLLLLLAMKGDERFAGSLVVEADGQRVLLFVEEFPKRFRPPPFKQAMQVVGFWLDEQGRIKTVGHRTDDQDSWPFVYRYSYQSATQVPFVQPSKSWRIPMAT